MQSITPPERIAPTNRVIHCGLWLLGQQIFAVDHRGLPGASCVITTGHRIGDGLHDHHRIRGDHALHPGDARSSTADLGRWDIADAAPCAGEPVIGPAGDPGWWQMVVRLARVRSMPRLARRGRAVR